MVIKMRYTVLFRKKYLLLPVCVGAENKKLSIHYKRKKQLELQIPCGSEEDFQVKFYAPIACALLPAGAEEITLSGELPGAFFRAVQTSDVLPIPPKYRPAIHFTAGTGWINDPNGLIYENDEYHLYFQYNPFDVKWENMGWGHAVSRDLLHWEQLDTVMLPDSEGTMFSGCAIKNDRGMLNLPKTAILYFYTTAGGTSAWSEGKPFVQCLAYSLDHGRTLKKRGTVVPRLKADSRDPKVFWHDTDGCYYMVLWLEGNKYVILKSTNLESFEITQTIELAECWECPDLFELSVEGTDRKKWVFWAADGYYFTCDFINGRLVDLSKRKCAYTTKLPYAAQTFSGTEECVIGIPWLRAAFEKELYTGAMGLPRVLSLKENDGELVLCQQPTAEYEAAKQAVFSGELKGKKTYHLRMATGEYACEMEITPIEMSGIRVRAGGKELMLDKPAESWRIILDRNLIEITSRDGSVFAAEEMGACREVEVNSVTGIRKVTLYQIK